MRTFLKMYAEQAVQGEEKRRFLRWPMWLKYGKYCMDLIFHRFCVRMRPRVVLLVDPHAADIVFRCGRPITVFGLDATHQVLATEERWGLAQANRRAEWKQPTHDRRECYRRHWERRTVALPTAPVALPTVFT